MSRFRHTALLLVLGVGAMPSPSVADVTKLPVADRKALENSTRFRDILTIRDLPHGIVTLCVGAEGNIADPGKPWEPTDAIRDRSLPTKRLIWAATDGHYYVVHYERGGIAHSFHVLVVTMKKESSQPSPVWRAVGGPFKDFTAFLAALHSGKLDDRLDYAH